MNEYELYHHGVKGMKWGVRRYRNADGMLTPAGKKHVERVEKRKQTMKKVGVKVAKIASDRRVQIGAAVATGIMAGAFGNMALARIATISAFRKTLSYGEGEVMKHLTRLANEEGYEVSEPTITNFGERIWRAYDYDSGAKVNYTQNLKTGSVTYDYIMPGGKSYSNGELLLPDDITGWTKNKFASVYEDLDIFQSATIGEYYVAAYLANSSDEFYHHGVKGMKWGIRRNKKQLGYKVSRGLKKAGKSLSENMKKQKAKRAAKIEKKKPKRVEDMTDEELNTAIRRLELEKRFKDLSPKTVSRGKAFSDSVIKNMILPAGEDVGKQLIKSGMVEVVNKAFNLNDELKVYTNNKKK